jgi:hypothetical protein
MKDSFITEIMRNGRVLHFGRYKGVGRQGGRFHKGTGVAALPLVK